jgi:acyl CoA:acetate/3-ketoacid CoA transferase
MELTEVAPGVDVDRDIVACMSFRPIIGQPESMPLEVFR